MLPTAVQFAIAMVASATNDRMQRRLTYPEVEVTTLRALPETATASKRLRFTPEQRRRLAVAGKALTPAERQACCHVVSPSTILVWFRALAGRKYDSSKVRRQDAEHRAAYQRCRYYNPERASFTARGYNNLDHGRGTSIVSTIEPARLRRLASGREANKSEKASFGRAPSAT